MSRSVLEPSDLQHLPKVNMSKRRWLSSNPCNSSASTGTAGALDLRKRGQRAADDLLPGLYRFSSASSPLPRRSWSTTVVTRVSRVSMLEQLKVTSSSAFGFPNIWDFLNPRRRTGAAPRYDGVSCRPPSGWHLWVVKEQSGRLSDRWP